MSAVRVSAPPTIDGRLDEPVWRSAARVTEFVQQRPLEGAPGSERTDVFIAYDSEALYVGVHAYYSDPTLMRANRVDRDATQNDDTVAIYFDPFLDQQRGYSFSVNGYGVQSDAMLVGTTTTPDTSWNVLFRSAGTPVEGGWTAEMAIPFRSLRYPGKGAGEVHRWGFQIQREIFGKNETVAWAPISNNVMGLLSQMGLLEGMRDLSTQRNLEVLPTVTTVATRRLDSAGGTIDDEIAEAGINVKYGLSSNVTLDVTYNPDFSQIESDRPQIEINQRFPLFFAELRPFFLEGQEIFKVPGPFAFLHTRTILDPQVGLKLTGKNRRTAFGLVVANDEAAGRAAAPVVPGGPPSEGSAMVASARVKVDTSRESFVAVIANDREFRDTHSRLALFDGSFRLGQNYRIQTTAGFTDHRDETGRRRRGHVLDTGFLKQGRALGFIIAENIVSPDFRNDAGFMSRVDYRKTIGNVSYRWWPQGRVINWGPRVQHERLYDFGGVLTDTTTSFTMQGTFANNISTTGAALRILERYRGVNFYKTRYTASATVNASRRVLLKADVSVGDETRFVVNPYLGRTWVFNGTVTLRPASRIQSDVTLNTTRFTDVRNDRVDFDVKILRATTTYQFTPRLLIRNILDANTLNRTLGLNLLGTYRVNAGTVFFVGYDDRYRQENRIDPVRYVESDYRRTNRAVFAKLQYLYRR